MSSRGQAGQISGKEVAGPWRPAATSPGVQVCEALPRLARVMDRLVLVRPPGGNQDGHEAAQVFTGHHPRQPAPGGGRPQLGAAVAHSFARGRPSAAGPAAPTSPGTGSDGDFVRTVSPERCPGPLRRR